MEFNKSIIIGAILVVVIAFAVVFLTGTMDRSKAFLNELEAYKTKLKVLEEKGYHYWGLSVVDGDEANVEVLKTKEGYWIKKETPIYTWELLNVNGTRYLCLTFNKRACGEAKMSLTKVADSLEVLLLTEELGDHLLHTWRVFYSSGAMKVEDSEVDKDRAYFKIRFSYADLSIEKLKELGYSPNMPISKLSNITFEVLFEDHILMDRNISFNQPYQHFERWYIERLVEEPNEELPNVEVNETAFYKEVLTFGNYLDELRRMQAGESKIGVRGLAVTYHKPQLCLSLLEDREEQLMCLDAYIAFTKDWKACEYLEKKDRCLFNVAKELRDKAVCDEIENVDLKAECFSVVLSNTTNTTNNSSS